MYAPPIPARSFLVCCGPPLAHKRRPTVKVDHFIRSSAALDHAFATLFGKAYEEKTL